MLATGHQWPADPQVRPGYFLSPWPASALAEIPPCDIAIRGSSLSAIDAAVGLAGLLPEADFFAPLPYEPLAICTTEAIEALIDAPDGELLDSAFELFKAELIAADPAYSARTRLADLALEEFCESYFADRMAVDPFEWARTNLAEAQRNYAAEYTVPWRYAILRMHEVIALLVPYLEQDDFQRFSRYFKPMFIDDYATVPHESIKRMLALHDAGKLDIVAIGDDYRIDSHRPEGGTVLHVAGEQRPLSVFIEATGQQPLGVRSFPFPSLLAQGIVRDAAEPDASGGVARDRHRRPVSPGFGRSAARPVGRLARHETRPDQAAGDQIGNPGRVIDVRLAAGNVRDVRSIRQDQLQRAIALHKSDGRGAYAR